MEESAAVEIARSAATRLGIEVTDLISVRRKPKTDGGQTRTVWTVHLRLRLPENVCQDPSREIFEIEDSTGRWQRIHYSPELCFTSEEMDERDRFLLSPSKYSFRVIKTSWGIAIDLVASAGRLDPDAPTPISVTPNVLLSADVSRFSQHGLDCLLLGARIMSSRLEAISRIQKPVVIRLNSVDHNCFDYQDEGLTAAMVGWICQAFELSWPDVIITYDKAANRYDFTWKV